MVSAGILVRLITPSFLFKNIPFGPIHRVKTAFDELGVGTHLVVR